MNCNYTAIHLYMTIQQLIAEYNIDRDDCILVIKRQPLAEPSLQKGLKELNEKVHEFGLGIIMFSGRYKNDLPEELVNSVDRLIDGPFVESKLDTKRILLGSANKNPGSIADRYKNQADSRINRGILCRRLYFCEWRLMCNEF